MLKYLILGAGPAGLSVANRLLEKGEKSFLVVEKEDKAGGLCRSKEVDGSPFDIGGIHLLEAGNDVAKNFLFQFMPEEEWNQYPWKGKIYFEGKYIDSPFESNIWQFDIERQIRYLKDVAKAGCGIGTEMPEKFQDWIYWKLGKSIADDYMIPYNSKMFYGLLDELGIDWLYKLPNVSFEDIIRSCLEKKAYGKLPGYGKKMFYYPKKYGFGEVWNRMADNLRNQLVYGEKIDSIDFFEHKINDKYQADIIINTIPWTEFNQIKGMPENLKNGIKKLKYTSVRVEYRDGKLDTDAAWVYFPNSNVSYHRAMCRNIFCKGAKGYGTETNIMVEPNAQSAIYFENEYTYPVNTVEKSYIMDELLTWCSNHKVIGLGRWGEWCHHNSDVVVKASIELVNRLCQ